MRKMGKKWRLIMSKRRGKMKGKNGFLAVFFFRKTIDFSELRGKQQ